MRLFDRLFATARDPRDAVRPLWHAVVAEARAPEWYRDYGVTDTLEGRFDMVTMVLALMILRMERSEALAPHSAPLTEIFVDEMDGQLRQSGVGDLMVGKQIGRLMSTLGGRIGALRKALADPSDDALEDAAARNVTLRDGMDADGVAMRLRELAGRLAASDDSALLAGEIG